MHARACVLMQELSATRGVQMRGDKPLLSLSPHQHQCLHLPVPLYP